MKSVKKAIAWIDQGAFGISCVCLVSVALIGVFFRFILNRPFPWIEEVEMILVVWSVFFGASIAVREKGHIAVDIVYDALPKRLKKVFSVIIWLVVLVAIAWITKLEINRVKDLIKSDLRTPVLRIPSYVEYIGVVFACVLTVLGHIINAAEALPALLKKEENTDE